MDLLPWTSQYSIPLKWDSFFLFFLMAQKLDLRCKTNIILIALPHTLWDQLTWLAGMAGPGLSRCMDPIEHGHIWLLQKHLQIPSEIKWIFWGKLHPAKLVTRNNGKRFGGIPTMPETFRLRNYSIIFCVYFKVQLSNYSPSVSVRFSNSAFIWGWWWWWLLLLWWWWWWWDDDMMIYDDLKTNIDRYLYPWSFFWNPKRNPKEHAFQAIFVVQVEVRIFGVPLTKEIMHKLSEGTSPFPANSLPNLANWLCYVGS